MKKEVRVWFRIEPKMQFVAGEQYPNLKITPEFENDRLTGLQVDVEVNLNDSDEVAIRKAKGKIAPLLERLRFLKNTWLEVELEMLQEILPQVKTPHTYSHLIYKFFVEEPCRLPREDELLCQQNDDTTYQLMFYNRGMKSEEATERIRNFYLVMEREAAINSSYAILHDLACTRHALSHHRLTRHYARSFLLKNIGCDSIDFNNPDHVAFVQKMVPEFANEALRILNNKVKMSLPEVS